MDKLYLLTMVLYYPDSGRSPDLWQACDTLDKLQKYKNIILDRLRFTYDTDYQDLTEIFEGRRAFSDGKDESGIGYLVACLEVNNPSWSLKKISDLKQPEEEFICKHYD